MDTFHIVPYETSLGGGSQYIECGFLVSDKSHPSFGRLLLLGLNFHPVIMLGFSDAQMGCREGLNWAPHSRTYNVNAHRITPRSRDLRCYFALKTLIHMSIKRQWVDKQGNCLISVDDFNYPRKFWDFPLYIIAKFSSYYTSAILNLYLSTFLSYINVFEIRRLRSTPKSFSSPRDI